MVTMTKSIPVMFTKTNLLIYLESGSGVFFDHAIRHHSFSWSKLKKACFLEIRQPQKNIITPFFAMHIINSNTLFCKSYSIYSYVQSNGIFLFFLTRIPHNNIPYICMLQMRVTFFGARISIGHHLPGEGFKYVQR